MTNIFFVLCSCLLILSQTVAGYASDEFLEGFNGTRLGDKPSAHLKYKGESRLNRVQPNPEKVYVNPKDKNQLLYGLPVNHVSYYFCKNVLGEIIFYLKERNISVVEKKLSENFGFGPNKTEYDPYSKSKRFNWYNKNISVELRADIDGELIVHTGYRELNSCLKLE